MTDNQPKHPITVLLEAMSEEGQRSRSQYHLTLGKLQELATLNPNSCFILDTDNSSGITNEHSYRGYYSDLAFSRSPSPTPASEVLAMCNRALQDTYEGYKGGDFTYTPKTPLWFASYGNSGLAIVSYEMSRSSPDIILTTKQVDV